MPLYNVNEICQVRFLGPGPSFRSILPGGPLISADIGPILRKITN